VAFSFTRAGAPVAKKNPSLLRARVLVLCDSPLTLREMREVSGREPIRQIGLACIFVALPVAELPQSLVSTRCPLPISPLYQILRTAYNFRPAPTAPL
jgi:hypothetical protein